MDIYGMIKWFLGLRWEINIVHARTTREIWIFGVKLSPDQFHANKHKS